MANNNSSDEELQNIINRIAHKIADYAQNKKTGEITINMSFTDGNLPSEGLIINTYEKVK